MLDIVIFYFFAIVILVAYIIVAFSNNVIHSFLSLIFILFGVAGLFVLLEAEIIAVFFVAMYSGFFSILMIFIVLKMDDIFRNKFSFFTNMVRKSFLFLKFFPFVGIVFFIFICEFFLIKLLKVVYLKDVGWENSLAISNIYDFSNVIFSEYIYIIEAIGFLFLVLIVGLVVMFFYDFEKLQDIEKK